MNGDIFTPTCDRTLVRTSNPKLSTIASQNKKLEHLKTFGLLVFASLITSRIDDSVLEFPIFQENLGTAYNLRWWQTTEDF